MRMLARPRAGQIMTDGEGARYDGVVCGLAQEEFEELFFDGGLEAANEGGGVGKWRYSFKCLVLGGACVVV